MGADGSSHVRGSAPGPDCPALQGRTIRGAVWRLRRYPDTTTGKPTTPTMTAASSVACILANVAAAGNLISAPGNADEAGAIPITNTTRREMNVTTTSRAVCVNRISMIYIQEGVKGVAIFFSLYVVWALLNILFGG